MDTLRAVVIGAGNLGTVHARNWAQIPGVEVVAIADPIAPRAESLAHELGVPRFFTDYREALALPDLHLASVATPTCFHYECTLAALEAGCHVLCEKPLAMSLDHGREMLARAGAVGRKLAVGFCKRFMGQVETVADLVHSGRLGRPVMYRHVSGWEIRPKPWIMDRHMGGGPLLDIACHYVDQCRVIFAADPVRVKAAGMLFSGGAPELPGADPQLDTFALTVEYESGDVLALSMSWGLPLGVGSESLEDCLGPRGLLKITPDTVTIVTRDGVREVLGNLGTDMYLRQQQAFADAVRGDLPVAADARDGLIALQVSLAAIESIETGEAVALEGI